MTFEKNTEALVKEAEAALADRFEKIDNIAFENTRRVMESFSRNRVSDSMFAGTTGYGYNDRGRQTLENVYADVFGAEAAIVRHSIINGTLQYGVVRINRFSRSRIHLTNQHIRSTVVGIFAYRLPAIFTCLRMVVLVECQERHHVVIFSLCSCVCFQTNSLFKEFDSRSIIFLLYGLLSQTYS